MSGVQVGPGQYLDWLEGTAKPCEGQKPSDLASEVAEQFGGMQIQPGRRGWYSSWGVVLGSGYISWDDTYPERGVHLCLPATALARLTFDWLGLAQCFLMWSGKWTRCDLAQDTNETDVPTVRAAVQSRNVVSHFRKAHRTDDLWGEGSTVTLGQRGSDSYVRIYDKRAERLAAGEACEVAIWTRCEVELRRDRANAAVLSLLAGENMAGIIRGVVDFRDRSQDENSAKCPQLDWWQRWLSGVTVVKLAAEKVKSDLDKMRRWVEKQVKVTLGVLLAQDGGDMGWIETVCKQGWAQAPRWKRDLVGVAV